MAPKIKEPIMKPVKAPSKKKVATVPAPAAAPRVFTVGESPSKLLQQQQQQAAQVQQLPLVRPQHSALVQQPPPARPQQFVATSASPRQRDDLVAASSPAALTTPSPAKIRKRITPVMISTADPDAASDNRFEAAAAVAKASFDSGAPAAAVASALAPPRVLNEIGTRAAESTPTAPVDLWGTDPAGTWEVCIRNNTGADEFSVCGMRRQEEHASRNVVWEHALFAPPRQLAVNGGFVALAVGLDPPAPQELHVLSVTTGRLAFPPLLMGGSSVHLELDSHGHLIALARDGSLTVWDLPKATCSLQTTLRHVCRPADVELLAIRPHTLEPLVRLANGRLLLFWTALKHWISLADGTGNTVDDVEERLPAQGGSCSVGGVAEGPRLEGELLSAACCCSAEEVRGSLFRLIRHCAERGDHSRIRNWSAAVSGRACNPRSVTSMSWITTELANMGFRGEDLITEVVLPALQRTWGTQELHAEIEALCLEKKVPVVDSSVAGSGADVVVATGGAGSLTSVF